MDNDLLIYIGQKAFIDKDGEVLILTDPKIGLDFPGGKVRKDEDDLKEALKREVREETGLEIEVGELFSSWMIEFPKDYRKQNKVFLVGYKCKYISGKVKLSHEHTKYSWVNKNNYKKTKDGSNYFKALDKYFSK